MDHIVVVLSLLFCGHSAVAQNRAPYFFDSATMNGFHISEETPVGSEIYRLQGKDPDGDQVFYSIKPENEELKVDAQTGRVILITTLVYNPLDYERKFTVIITDVYGLEFELHISIFIDDSNNNEPKFTKDTYQITIPESTPVNTTIIRSLSATDEDYKQASLSVTCNVSAIENPDESQTQSCETFLLKQSMSSNKEWRGELILQKPLDFETRIFYQVPLVLSDGKHYILQSIEINLEDVNDAPPLFVRALSTIIDENTPAFSYITYVLARDGDVNKPRGIAYELTCQNDSFAIQSTPYGHANITSRMLIDKESDLFQERGYVMLCIKAREIKSNGAYGNDPLTTADTTIRITVRDMNDNAPTFHQDHFTVSIYESIPNLSSLPDLFMTVTDRDSSTANSYDLVLTNHNDVYDVHPNGGQGQTIGVIRVINSTKIDYEKGPRTFILRVEARENFKGMKFTGTATVTVLVLDVNDNVPHFQQSTYVTKVKEDETQGFQIVTVSVVDLDSGDMGAEGVRFSLVGNGAYLFEINNKTGVVKVAYCATPGKANCINYERKKRFDLNVLATDEKGNGLTSNADLIINVIDVNDNNPVFDRGEYINSIMEGKIITLDPLIVRASDRDVADKITYSIPGNNPANTFWQINPQTGNVTAINPIRFEDATTKDKGLFYFKVQATDGKFVQEVPVTIYVIDVNDNAPKFKPRIYRQSINETTTGGYPVLTVTATDMDSNATEFGQIEYQIRSGAEGKFEIHFKNGSITTTPTATFDYDITKEYKMIIVAHDGGNPQKTGTATVFIEITDKNNKNPYFQPNTQRVDVKEDVRIGTSVATIIAKDPDANVQLEYTFIEPITAINPEGIRVNPNRINFKSWFVLNLRTGYVQTNSLLDRDQASVLTLTMRVVDITAVPRQTGTGTLIITVLEVNDQSPEWPDAPYRIEINEEQAIGTFIMTLIARDADDSIASYRLVDNRHNFFAISPSTGVLTINDRIDYDRAPYISLTTFTVLATDSGLPPRGNQTVVSVRIKNINDNSPIFDKNTYNKDIPEDTPAGTQLLTVHAQDLDREDYGVVRYRLDPSETRFTIGNENGVLTLTDKAKLDRETQSVVSLQVVAYDSPNDATVRRYISVPVYFILEDVNDNDPKFSSANYEATIIETIDIGAQVIQMFVSDADIGQNAQIVYTYVENSAKPKIGESLFSVGKLVGRIIVAVNLRGHAGTYMFKVYATDLNGAANGRRSVANIRITITSAVNAPPKWLRPPYTNYTISVLESQYLGMLVYDAHAEDNDTGITGIVDYSFLVPGQGYVQQTPAFGINPVTGVIRAEKVYDREGPEPRYVLELAARDRGSPRLVQTRFLFIDILDVNDNKPVFEMENGKTKPIVFPKVKETAPVNTFVGQVNATDLDSKKYSKIYYYIISGNDDNIFYLESVTGKMYLAKPLDHEKQSEYLLYVFATNNITDYSVKWNRRRRSADPSIATVLIPVEDENDAPPVFVGFNSPVSGVNEYYGCVPNTASYGRSVVTVSATDADSQGPSGVTFSIAAGNVDGVFRVHPETGVVSNQLLLNAYTFHSFVLVVRASDAVTRPAAVTAKVKIFVTSPESEVKLVINQKATEVQNYVAQIQRILQKQKNVHFVCITKIRDHLRPDGTISDSVADVFVSAAYTNPNSDTGYSIFSTKGLANELNQNYTNKQADLNSLHITSINLSEESSSFLSRVPVLAVLIIIILLVIMALILFCIACYCIAGSRAKKTEKATAAQRTHIYQEPVVEQVKVADERPPQPVPQAAPVMSANPVYDNQSFQPDEEYAVVRKVKRSEEQEPVIVAFVDSSTPPPLPETGPVIETYPVDEDGAEEYLPPPADFLTREASEIEVEIKEGTPLSTPVSTPRSSHRHDSPPSPATNWQIDTQIRE